MFFSSQPPPSIESVLGGDNRGGGGFGVSTNVPGMRTEHPAYNYRFTHQPGETSGRYYENTPQNINMSPYSNTSNFTPVNNINQASSSSSSFTSPPFLLASGAALITSAAMIYKRGGIKLSSLPPSASKPFGGQSRLPLATGRQDAAAHNHIQTSASFQAQDANSKRIEASDIVLYPAFREAVHTSSLEKCKQSSPETISGDDYEMAENAVFNMRRTHMPMIRKGFFNPKSPENFFGSFSVSSDKSAVINITSMSDANRVGYTEIVVYTFPDWKVAFSGICTDELFMDDFAPGNYCAVVFSPFQFSATLETGIANTRKKRPLPRPLKSFTKESADLRECAIDSIVSTDVNNNKRDLKFGRDFVELACVSSYPVFMWPGAVHTRVESVEVSVPEKTLIAYLTLPSYGFVTEGREHIDTKNGSAVLVHEGDCIAIYKIKPPSSPGSKIRVTVVYPGMESKTNVVNTVLSPPILFYAFG